MMRYSLLFNRRVALIIALLLSQIEITYGREIKEQQLAKDEAYILVAFEGELIKNLKFSRVGTDERIPLTKNWDLIKVKEGHVYLKLIKSHYFNVYIPPFPEPSSEKNSAYIKAGTITYIGEWHFERKVRPKLRWDLDIKYPNTHLLKVLESNPWVEKYPLHIGFINGKTMNLLWE